MDLRSDVQQENVQIMRVNLYEAVVQPPLVGETQKTTILMRQIVARTVLGDSHYNKDIDDICRVVRSDIADKYRYKGQEAEVSVEIGGSQVIYTVKRTK